MHFLTMYRDVPFRVEPMEQIEEDLNEAARRYPHVKRVFPENGDAFVLKAARLAQIAAMIREKLPSVEIITMYASIRTKTDDELRRLRALGINDLNIGAAEAYPGAEFVTIEGGIGASLLRS